MKRFAILSVFLLQLTPGASSAEPPPDGVQVFRETCLDAAPDFDGLGPVLTARGYVRLDAGGSSRAVHVDAGDFTVFLRGDPGKKAPGDLIVETGAGTTLDAPASYCLVLAPAMTAAQTEAALSDILDPAHFLAEREGLFYTLTRKWVVKLPKDANAAATVSIVRLAGRADEPGASLVLEVFDSSVLGTAFEFAR